MPLILKFKEGKLHSLTRNFQLDNAKQCIDLSREGEREVEREGEREMNLPLNKEFGTYVTDIGGSIEK